MRTEHKIPGKCGRCGKGSKHFWLCDSCENDDTDERRQEKGRSRTLRTFLDIVEGRTE